MRSKKTDLVKTMSLLSYPQGVPLANLIKAGTGITITGGQTSGSPITITDNGLTPPASVEENAALVSTSQPSATPVTMNVEVTSLATSMGTFVTFELIGQTTFQVLANTTTPLTFPLTAIINPPPANWSCIIGIDQGPGSNVPASAMLKVNSFGNAFTITPLGPTAVSQWDLGLPIIQPTSFSYTI